MTAPFLIAAVGSGVAALVIALPAWRSWQARVTTDRNAERYLAWRGRADRPDPGGGQMTSSERRRIAIGIGLAVVAVACLVIGLSTG